MGLAGIVLLAAGASDLPAARRANLVVGLLWLSSTSSPTWSARTINVQAIDDHDAGLLLLASLALLAVGLVLLPGAGRCAEHSD